jgi:hypothetical protein
LKQYDSDVDLIAEWKRRCAIVRAAVSGDVDRCLRDGKNVVVEGALVDPALYALLLPPPPSLPSLPSSWSSSSLSLSPSPSSSSSSSASPSLATSDGIDDDDGSGGGGGSGGGSGGGGCGGSDGDVDGGAVEISDKSGGSVEQNNGIEKGGESAVVLFFSLTVGDVDTSLLLHAGSERFCARPNSHTAATFVTATAAAAAVAAADGAAAAAGDGDGDGNGDGDVAASASLSSRFLAPPRVIRHNIDVVAAYVRRATALLEEPWLRHNGTLLDASLSSSSSSVTTTTNVCGGEAAASAEKATTAALRRPVHSVHVRVHDADAAVDEMHQVVLRHIVGGAVDDDAGVDDVVGANDIAFAGNATTGAATTSI